MTKKDYIEFAKACARLRRFKSTYDKDGDALVKMKDVEEELADIFSGDNGRFDKDRFLSACSGK